MTLTGPITYNVNGLPMRNGIRILDYDEDGCLDDNITDESGRVTHTEEDSNDDNDSVNDWDANGKSP